MSVYGTASFKKLKKDWYNKLRSKGFVDIEDTSSPREYLKVWEDSYFRAKYSFDVFQAKQAYFQLACSFVESYDFKTKKERRIWELHAQGHSLRFISRTLRVTVHRTHTLIHELRKVMLENR